MKRAIKFGFFAGLLIGMWNMIVYFFLYDTFLNKLSFIINLLILLLLLYNGIKNVKNKGFQGEITFANAGLAGILISICAAVCLALITYLYWNINHPNYKKYFILETQMALKSHKIKDSLNFIEDLQKSFTPINQAQSSFVITLIIGIVFSFVFAMILRNKTVLPIETNGSIH